MDNSVLMRNLSELGVSCVEMNGLSGGSIVAANASARVIRLTGESGVDFLWMNKGLETLDKAALFTDEGWLNLGGDRIWIAPESDIHVSDIKRWSETHRVPQEMDPGKYAIEKTSVGVEMKSEYSLRNYRLNSAFDISVTRTIEPSANPLKDIQPDGDLQSVEFVGYHQRSELRLLSETPGLQIGIWHLAQVPAVGEIFIPLTVTADPKVYFGPENAGGLEVKDSLVRLKVDASKYYKIGIKAAYATGRAGFARPQKDGNWTLLVQNFSVYPSMNYVDYPADDLNDRGYAVQCFTDDGSLGSFGEVEHHAPGIGDGTGYSARADESDLWGFHGDKNSIERIGELLLGRKVTL